MVGDFVGSGCPAGSQEISLGQEDSRHETMRRRHVLREEKSRLLVSIVREGGGKGEGGIQSRESEERRGAILNPSRNLLFR